MEDSDVAVKKCVATFRLKYTDGSDLFTIKVDEGGGVSGRSGRHPVQMMQASTQLAGIVFSQASFAEAFVQTRGAPSADLVEMEVEFLEALLKKVAESAGAELVVDR